MKKMIRVSEAARQLQVTPATIRNMIERGHFPGATKIDPTLRNSPLRIPEDEIKAYIAQRK